MIQIIMRSDRDNDMRVDLDEAEMLALRLGIQLQTHGIVLDRDMFMSMLEEDNSVESIIIFCAEVSLFSGWPFVITKLHSVWG